MDWQVFLKNHNSPRLSLIKEETLIIIEDKDLLRIQDLALQPLEFRINYVEEFVKSLLCSLSGADIAELDLNVGLHKYGIDSIAATNMSHKISNSIGASFEVSILIKSFSCS